MFYLIETAHAGVISDALTLKEVGINILGFLLSIVGIIAIIMMIVSGALYFFSAGNEKMAEIAKKSLTYGVIGIVMALGGIIVVKTLSIFLS
ncbi:MAG TPA: hypothetical protein PLB52_01755 [Candidatus Moranbacteria bacterium]|nr:hypothetical protein [Candidatus Moranbacteria bacterium]